MTGGCFALAVLISLRGYSHRRGGGRKKEGSLIEEEKKGGRSQEGGPRHQGRDAVLLRLTPLFWPKREGRTVAKREGGRP